MHLSPQNVTAEQGVIVAVGFIDREIMVMACQSELKYLKGFKQGQYRELLGEFLKYANVYEPN